MSKAKAPADRPPKRIVDGILLLDKPMGITSNRALQMAKHFYRACKAGHTGSLDPLASGMLPLCFGQATKVSGFLLDADKEYEVEALIGTRTDTADADGVITETASKGSVTAEELEAALVANRGPQDQVPPMYSALKQNGKRLYDLARQGLEVKRPARPVIIHELSVVRYDPQQPILKVRCSKGTYVRTLVESIAEHMGTLAHVSMLRRVSVGAFADEPLVTMQELEAREGDLEALDALLLTPDVALAGYPEVRLSASEAFYLRNGHAVGHAGREIEGLVRVYDEQSRFLALGEVQPDGQVAPKRLFINPA
ncbi:MAG: tRNA pseudouridine(55) synthase TruB [Gammaproteobacteria bacterium]|nr:tRNA pseudouridine(55) synthase TruB [Gammaproteobacteria bacterium]MCP4090028.1 tRNA pseudouridine(55) synthase TruB [Gammaproteobacteria bacterium]MCP4277753.1 tRNA pseudouridine(55) synthase TruB [Gammaproteobacteria bacterium]MCP4832216.1 tRNA pseudouridine(55) synthase TruB [Gammaproteobacteria bacterium]MCP4929283.1 tRNA pseudouridine(55) synthase TruB [Gammaproteobacteria bacterium]